MKIAIWTVTRAAGYSALKIKEKIDADIYTLAKFDIKDTINIGDFTKELKEKFNLYDGHIFIMATGIVIRKISTLIKSKDIDPAVLVVDEGLNFAISLLSGHIGGANELTNKIASTCNIVPIITTSSDVNGKIAIDMLSEKLQCEMESLEKAKDVTSVIVDNKNVEIFLPNNVKFSPSEFSPEGVVIISNKEKIKTIQLFPKNIIIGIGCKAKTKEENILHAIDNVMKKHNLSYKSIKKIATVDIKKEEIGLLKAAKTLNKGLVIINRDEIKKVEHLFKGSNFVKEKIGVSCVSEPCAYLASNKNGKFLEMKYIENGITISIYEEKIGYE